MKSPYCSELGCERYREGQTEFCASHNAIARKEKRSESQPTSKPRPLKKTFVKKVSEKRKEQNEEYLEEHEPFLMLHPLCEACGDKATEVHHRAGRFGERLNDQSLWMSVCRPCHKEIHDNPEWAREQGFLILRSTT